MTKEERISLTRSASVYEPPVNEIKSRYEELVKQGVKMMNKIIANDGQMVGWIEEKNRTAFIGSWSYPIDGWTFKSWCELNHITLAAA